MIALLINGQPRHLDLEAANLSTVIAQLGYAGPGFAVAVDGDFVPRSAYESYRLKGGESVEILSPMQGG